MSKPLLPEILLCQFFELDEPDGDSRWRLIDVGYAYVNKASCELILYQNESQQEVHKHEISFDYDYQQCEGYDRSLTDEVIQFAVGHKDYAFSFQNKAGAEAIWAKLQDVLQAQLRRQEAHKQNLEEMKAASQQDDSISVGQVSERSLPKLLNYLMQLGGGAAKLALSQLMVNKRNYLDNLQKLFDAAEVKRSDGSTLRCMCAIVKQLVIHADYELLQILLSDQYYQMVFGALEYDDEMQKNEFIPHRRYLQYHSCFVSVVEFRDKSKVQLIHFIYRLTYLRDCVLAYFMDEFQMMFFVIIIKNCYAELISYIENSRDLLVLVVDEIRNYNFNALKLLHEICQVLKDQQDINKILIYEKLNEYDLYEILEEYVRDYPSQRYQSKIKKKMKFKSELVERVPAMCLEILVMSVTHQPNYLRAYVTSETQMVLKYPFLNQIIDNVVACRDLGLQQNFCALLEGLLDSMEFEVNEVQELFFTHFPKLLNQLDCESSETSLQFKSCFLEICANLSRFIRPRVKEVFASSGLMQKFGDVMRQPQQQKFVNLKILQLIKMLLLSKDEDMQHSLRDCLPGLIWMFLSYRRRQENLIYAIMLQVIQIIYSVSPLSLQEALESGLQQHFTHPNFCRTLQTFKEQADRSNKPNEQSLFSDVKLQETLKHNQFTGHRGEYDDIDLFSSQGMQIELERTKDKSLVDYDEEDQEDKDDDDQDAQQVEDHPTKKIKL